ncbi:hypothetical protein LINGRAHAP2_LOCUS2201 [Linum grandiflorum]
MKLEDISKCVIDYIFDESLPLSETLVRNEAITCTRYGLLTLKPSKWLDEDVSTFFRYSLLICSRILMLDLSNIVCSFQVITALAYQQTTIEIRKHQNRDDDLFCFLPSTLIVRMVT